MNFEFTHEKYWKELSFEEAKLYCFSLNINGKTGWRLPTSVEGAYIGAALIDGFPSLYVRFWNGEIGHDDIQPCFATTIPVRDLKDD
jgi:hypothetical protein